MSKLVKPLLKIFNVLEKASLIRGEFQDKINYFKLL